MTKICFTNPNFLNPKTSLSLSFSKFSFESASTVSEDIFVQSIYACSKGDTVESGIIYSTITQSHFREMTLV